MSDSSRKEAVSFEHVLQMELEEIRQARTARRVYETLPDDPDPESQARSSELLGLAFSGGGIRSATFNLGVLQALAKYQLLPQIDYLSTVSGGGYIGAWFIAQMEKDGTKEQVKRIQASLSPEQADKPQPENQSAIEFLRQYSNYLTPRFVFYSADVWTIIATWSRNFLLNLLLLISTIGTLLLVPRLLGLLFTFKWHFSDTLDAVASAVFFAITGAMLCIGLSPPSERWRATQWRVQWTIVWPLFLGVVFLARSLRFSPEFFHGKQFWSSIRLPWLFFAIVFSLIAAFSGLWRCFLKEHPNLFPNRSKRLSSRITLILGVLLFVLAFSVPSSLTSLMLWGFAGWVQDWAEPQRPWALVTWGPPALVLLLSIGTAVLVGIFGMDVDAQKREWLSRLRAWTAIYSAAWIIVFGGAVYGPLLVLQLLNWAPWAAKGLSLSWIVTSVAGVLSGRSARTGDKTTATLGNRAVDYVARIAPFVFMAGFILLLASALNWVVTLGLFAPQTRQQSAQQLLNVRVTHAPPNLNIDIKSGQAESRHPELVEMQNEYFRVLSSAVDYIGGYREGQDFTSAPLNLFLILFAAGALLAFRLDINVFSLHEFYKNRLVRCYLGAVRCRDRNPDPFTGFDGHDDRPLAQFNCSKGGKYYGPYPIVNTTMNVSTGEKLAWQERKSAPFIFAPLYSGFNSEKGNERMRLGEEEAAGFAYRPTDHYCYPRGVNLGTAVAVSGAAASPNQGYHTSTAVAFLMTVFDVRLGWWVGNPHRDDTYRCPSPRFNLIALSQELFGLANSRAGFVNLSDGGHFDNMGLYELVRRQCRYIIVSDAEQDGELAFASFTQAIRNCRTDFGVEIKISLDRIKRKEKLSSAHCVVGTIEYPAPNSKPGYLLYLKSSLTGDESADVTGYQTAHSEFPHQSTGNQWFTESQFEAYRKLGQHIVETALGSVRSVPCKTNNFIREDLFKELQDLWYPPSDRVDRLSTKHAERFTDLTLDLADKDQLEFLDSQIFVGWPPAATDTAPWERSAKHRCGALIEFMESVYSELNLESPLEKEHPHNRGWLRIFEHWVQQPLFEETWQSTRKMYSERFQAFYADRVKAAQQPKVRGGS